MLQSGWEPDMALLTEQNNLARKSMEFDFAAFEREINELQEDFEALDAANGDFNIAFGSFSGGYTDEQVDEMNRLKEEEDIVSGMMAGLLEQCMLEEDRAFVDGTVALHDYLIGMISGPTFQAPLQTLDELHAWRGASVGDVVFVADELTAYILTDANKWLSFGTSMVSAHPVERTTDGMVMITTPIDYFKCEIQIAADQVSLFDPTMIDAPPSKKILSSRTPSHEFLLEKRAENDLRRRNEGKKILSSRG